MRSSRPTPRPPWLALRQHPGERSRQMCTALPRLMQGTLQNAQQCIASTATGAPRSQGNIWPEQGSAPRGSPLWSCTALAAPRAPAGQSSCSHRGQGTTTSLSVVWHCCDAAQQVGATGGEGMPLECRAEACRARRSEACRRSDLRRAIKHHQTIEQGAAGDWGRIAPHRSHWLEKPRASVERRGQVRGSGQAVRGPAHGTAALRQVLAACRRHAART